MVIEMERKLLAKMGQVLAENQTLREEMLRRMEKTVGEQEVVSRGMEGERLRTELKMGEREEKTREWVSGKVDENYKEYSKILNAKMIEMENKMKQVSVPLVQTTAAKQESIVKELDMKEQFDNLSVTLRADLLSLLDEDKKLKNIRFEELFHLMESNKGLINEHIQQQFESMRALMKAFVAKEVAERVSGERSLVDMVNKRLDQVKGG